LPVKTFHPVLETRLVRAKEDNNAVRDIAAVSEAAAVVCLAVS
jgi:hypothetical protein